MLGLAVLAAIIAAAIPHLNPGQARDLNIPGTRAVLVGQERSIKALAFFADGSTLATLGEQGGVQFWDAGMAWPQACLPTPGRYSYGMAISPDGRSVLIADSNGPEPTRRPRSLRSLRVDDAPFRLPYMGSIAPQSEVTDLRLFAGNSLAFSTDGRLIASGGLQTVDIRERSKLRLQKTVRGTFEIPARLAFSPDNKLLAVGDGGGGVVLLDLSEGTTRFERPKIMRLRPIESEGEYGHVGTVSTLVFAADGERLISLGQDNRVKVWDTATGGLVKYLKIGEQAAFSYGRSILAVASAGKELLTASDTGEFGLWDLDTGRVLKAGRLPRGPLVEPNYRLTELAISPDGKMLAGAIKPDSSRGVTGQGSLIVLRKIEELLNAK
jgi:WD40 repeat protein